MLEVVGAGGAAAAAQRSEVEAEAAASQSRAQMQAIQSQIAIAEAELNAASEELRAVTNGDPAALRLLAATMPGWYVGGSPEPTL